MKIACIGEAMIELSLARDDTSRAIIGFAGDTLNTAVYLQRDLESAKTASEHSVHYITAVGTDNFSDQIVSLIERENLNTDYIKRVADRVPGLYSINIDSVGERSFTYWRDQSAARTLFSTETGPEFRSLMDFDIIYYSAISLAILPESIKQQWLEFLQSFREQPGKCVAFDSNYRPRLWDSQSHAQQYTKAAYTQCDIALPSLDDEMSLFNDKSKESAIKRLASYNISRGALKCGAAGVIDLAAPAIVHELPTLQKVVDSTAAGDSFNGAYLAAIIMNKSSDDCIAAGHACAMAVVSFPGGIVDRATWDNRASVTLSPKD
jgi:2-dehydro-3-deoxygluconokinase